jgi:uncharacterized membrane protein
MADSENLAGMGDEQPGAAGRVRARVLLLLATLIVVWAFAQGVRLYEHLPQRIPIHFGAAGRPDGWAGKGFFSVYGLLIAGAAMLVVMALVFRLSARWYNFPGKERVLRLPPAQQAYAIAPMQELLAWIGAAIAIAFSFAARQTWEIALGQRRELTWWLLLTPAVVGIGGAILGIAITRARLRALEEQQ